MKTTHNEKKQCGSRVFNSINCHNKIRKVAHNKFERILLCGKHAFNYSVIVENKESGALTETIFPNRNAALCFFILTKKKYE